MAFGDVSGSPAEKPAGKPSEKKAEAPEKQFKIELEGGLRVLKISAENTYAPSIEDDASVMARIFDIILDSGKVSKIVFLRREEYIYDHSQVNLINEIVAVYERVVRDEGLLGFGKMRAPECAMYAPGWHDFLTKTILRRLKEDPIGAFVEIQRRLREEQIKQTEPPAPDYPACSQGFIQTLQLISSYLAETKLIRMAGPHLAGLKVGDRAIYKRYFRPTVQPYFIYTKLIASYPTGAEEIDSYKIAEDTQVLILKLPNDIRMLYHLVPVEFKLTEEKYGLLTEAREVLAEHRPERAEFIDQARTREIFFRIGRDLLSDLVRNHGMKLTHDELDQLARIFVRYTIGFGLIEILLSDEKIQDLVVNAPLGSNTISIIHADYGECKTNIAPLPKEGDSWATKLRLISGRPLDEANPVLDSDLILPYARARVAALQRPLSPAGFAFAFRRHRDKSWTLPLFIKNKMMTPLAAGLISFLVDGARKMLIAGTRSAGKTSLLGAPRASYEH